MTQYTADALSAPHSQREIGMIEDGEKGNPVSGDLISREALAVSIDALPDVGMYYHDDRDPEPVVFRAAVNATLRALPSAQPTAEVERLQEMLEGKFNLIESAVVNEWKARAEKAEAALAAMTAERDAAFAAGIEAAAQVADRNSSKAERQGRGDFIAHRIDADSIRALTTTDQRAAFDKLVAERVAAELVKRGEPVAWQHLKDGKWVECSEVVAKEWGDRYGPIYVRPLYAHQAPASAGVTVKPLEWGYNLSCLISADDYEIHTEGSMGTNGHFDPRYKLMRLGRVIVGVFRSIEDAKAAAQADYERRILAALSPTVEQGEG